MLPRLAEDRCPESVRVRMPVTAIPERMLFPEHPCAYYHVAVKEFKLSYHILWVHSK